MTIITGLITALRRHLRVHQTLRISDDTRIAFDLRRDPDKLLLLLICSDAVFVILHAFHRYSGFFTDPQFSITKDRGFASRRRRLCLDLGHVAHAGPIDRVVAEYTARMRGVATPMGGAPWPPGTSPERAIAHD